MRRLDEARRKAALSRPGSDWNETIEALFDRIPFGLFTASGSGTVITINAAARDLLLGERGPSRQPLTCCELVCERVADGQDAPQCLTQRVLATMSPSGEIGMRLAAESAAKAAWVTVSPLGADAGAIFHLRAEQIGESSDPGQLALANSRLRVFCLGQTRVESAATGSLGGEWIEQRPGQLLKYLVCTRRRVAEADEIAQALWPDGDARALGSVRYFVHTLRVRLEPTRGPRAPSSFVLSRSGGYALNPSRVWIDATEFEQSVAAGLAALAAGQSDVALARLERAMNLYRGDFLDDEPYAEWAFEERDRLRELAGRALRALTEMRLASDDVELAARHARLLAELEPYDADVQRRHIEISLRRGRRSEAVRRYDLFRRRLAREFDDRPDFDLADLTGDDS